MNTLLLFFALPVATIILAIVVEKILRCPFFTAATFFAIYLIVAFAAFDASFLVFVIAYTIIAFITAVITNILCRLNNCCHLSQRRLRSCNSSTNNTQENVNDPDTANLVTLSNRDINAIANQIVNMQNQIDNENCNCSCNNNQNTVDNTLAVNVRGLQTGNRSSWCCYRR